MIDRIELTLPWAALASVNVRTNPAGFGKMKGRQFLTQKYRHALGNARMLVAGQVQRLGGPYEGRVTLTLDFYLPDRRRRDCGNYVKLIEDALTDYVYADDKQIKRQVWEERGIDRDNPRVELTIEPYREAA